MPVHENIDILLEQLGNQTLDLVIAKKQENIELNKNIVFIHLGFLHDVLITNSNNPKKDIVFTKKDFENEIIFTPRKISDTTKNLMNTLNLNENNYRFLNNETVIDMVKSENCYGVISKEYIKKEIEDDDIAVLKINFELPKTEYGLYINKDNKFNELNDLIDIFKKQNF